MLGTALCQFESSPLPHSLLCELVFCSSSVFHLPDEPFHYGFVRKRSSSHCSIVLQHGKGLTKINSFRYSVLYSNILVYRNKGCTLANPCHYISEDHGDFVERDKHEEAFKAKLHCLRIVPILACDIEQVLVK